MRICGRLGLVSAVVVLALPTAASALPPPSFTWSGATTDTHWSNAGNWVEGTAPSGSVGTLTFPTLTSPGCTANPPTDACYFSNNDISGVSANALSFNSSQSYNIQGNGITLGAGGLTASPPSQGPGYTLNLPITLGAAQTWSIGGASAPAFLDVAQSVSGTADALNARLAQGSFVILAGDAEVGPFSAVGADTGLSGMSANANGAIEPASSLNATDGNAVNLTDAGLQASRNASVGPLTSTGGEIELSFGGSGPGSVTGAILTVAGSVALDSASATGIAILAPGTTSGADYSQMSASGPVSLSGDLFLFEGPGCQQLHVGDIDTLITTTGALSGTFTGIPDGTPVQVNGCGGPTVRINYTAHTVTATVLTAGAPASSTTLAASPSNPVTNQPVMLTATITAASGTPSGGTVQFADNNGPITGCDQQPVSWNGTTGTATCQTSFAASSSPEELFAGFSPTNGSVQGSGSMQPVDLPIGQDSTATALATSKASPNVGQSVTYTAMVTPGHAGSVEPSGTVQFLDGGVAIAGCGAQLPSAGGSATCTVSYGAAGSHTITAAYSGDGNFAGSTSPAQTVNVVSPSTANKPANTAAPVASGAAVVGQTESVSTGTWSGTAPIAYAYQWKLCNPGCADIAGATASSYTLIPADAGASVEAIVTASNVVGSAPATSNALGPVVPSGSQIAAALASVLSPHGKGARIGALLAQGGYGFTFFAPGPGTLTINWDFLPRGAHLSKAPKPKPIVIASLRISFTHGGAAHVTVRLTSAGRRMLHHARTLAVVSKASYQPTGGKTTSKMKRVTLRR